MHRLLFFIVLAFSLIEKENIAQDYALFEEEISLQVQGFTEQIDVTYILE